MKIGPVDPMMAVLGVLLVLLLVWLFTRVL